MSRYGTAFAILVMLAGCVPVRAAQPQSNGRDLFHQECAKCHGRNGDGVKGKYDGRLHGERSLEKLTRYIERNMPDDNPGKLSAENAAAVAHYIYETFYSSTARMRSTQPPRVELVRLTNPQYLNSVADLIAELSGSTGVSVPPDAANGLQATYYNSKEFNEGKKLIERVDSQVDADFGERPPNQEFRGTNGFSIEWRGSLKTEDTGDYEIVLITPNGARVWLNDDVEPLIDAWVASGKDSEHRARIRLIGGRLYPLRLKFFKAKENTSAIVLQWRPPRGVRQTIPACNLSPSRANAVFVVPTPFPPDDNSLGYERGQSVSKAWDEATTAAAIEIANYVAANLDRLSKSKSGESNRVAKLMAFSEEFTSAAFHRPLNEAERNLFVVAQFKNISHKPSGPQPSQKSKSTDTPPQRRELEDAMKRVVLLTLKSPRFLYLGLDDARPDDFEVAARLAYGLWDSLPDASLRKMAADRKLHSPEEVAAQALRMLKNPRCHAKMLAFFHHWLQMDRVESLTKDEKVFPEFGPAIIGDLRTSLNLFLEEVMWSDGSDYRKLLLADYMFLNQRLAAFYGLATNDLMDFKKVSFDRQQRCGVLTHPYLLAAFSYAKFTSPIHRGVFLTRNIVGRSLKPPPMAMTFKDADFAPSLTMREKVSQLTRPQACQNCHSVINPLGFSLEQFDAVGRFRTTEHDNPVDTVSDYLTEDGQTIHLAGARDVAEFALGSEAALRGFIEQLFHHVVKQPALAYGAGTLDRLREHFVKSDFDMQKLLVEIATSSALHGVRP